MKAKKGQMTGAAAELTPTLGQDSAYTISNGTADDYNFTTTDGSTTNYYKINFNNSNITPKSFTWTVSDTKEANSIPVVLKQNGANVTKYLIYTPYIGTDAYTSSDRMASDLPESIQNKVFLNNTENSRSYGGAIHNESASIDSITADFVGNSATVSDGGTNGGAIYNNAGTINSITGDFIGNSVSNSGDLYGGAIYNSGTINSIIGDFVGNRANGIVSAFNISSGGAIYNNAGTINSITGDFVGNSTYGTWGSNGGAIYNYNGIINSITGDFIGNSAKKGGAIYNYGTITLGDTTFTGNTVGQPNGIYNSGIINIKEGATVTVNDGWKSANSDTTKLVMGEGSTLNMNIANGVVQADGLGALTKNGTINATVDIDFANKKADTIQTYSVTLEDGVSDVLLNGINFIGEPTNVADGTKFQILKTQTGGLQLALAEELKTPFVVNREITEASTDTVQAITNWNDKLYSRTAGDVTTTAALSLATTTTENDSIALSLTREGEESVATSLGDTLALVVKATTPAERQFLAGDATGAYEVTQNLGTMGGTSLTIDGKNSNGVNLGINGNGYEGITVNSGQTLTLKNIGYVEKTYDENGYLTDNYTLNSSFGGFKKTGNGGAIYNNGGTLNIENVVFANNNATSSSSTSGGAIYNSGTINSITGDFVGNYASGSHAYGGAIYNYGTGAIIGSITGDFVGNYASSSPSYSGGGAIYNGYNSTISSITGDFVGNYASGSGSSSYYIYGGAIYNTGTINSITGDFVSNSASSSSSIPYVYGGAIYNSGTINSITGDFVSNSASFSSSSSIPYVYGGAIFNYGTITLGDTTFIDNKADSKPNSIYNQGTINIAEGATVTVNDGWQSSNYSSTKLVMGEGSTLNMNIANGVVQSDGFGALTKNGTINATVDIDLANKTADSISTYSVALTDGISDVVLNDINFIGEPNNIAEGTKFQILKTQTGGLQLALADAIENREYSFNIPVTKTAEAIQEITNWDKQYNYTVLSEGQIYGNFGLATTTTTNDSLAFNKTRDERTTSYESLGDTLALVVQATTPAERQFLAGDATGAYEVTANLGTMGATSLTIDGKNSNGVNLGINGNGYDGINVNSGKTLTIKNIGSVEKTYDANGNLTSDYTLNSSFSGFKKSSPGGAIYNQGTLNIENVVFANNSSSRGGAIFNYSNGIINSITGDFIGNSVTTSSSDNTYGGAIYNTSRGTINSISGNFIGNSATVSPSKRSYGGAIYNDGTINSITGDFVGNSASYSGGAIFNYGTITLGDTTFIDNKADSKPNSIYNQGTINIAEGATVTVNDGWQSYYNSSTKLVMGEGSTLNMNIANGVVQEDNLGVLTKNGTINATVDIDLANKTADSISTYYSVTLTDGISDVVLNDINFIGEPNNIADGTKFQILKTQTGGLQLVLSDALKTKEYLMSSTHQDSVASAINAVTNWNDKYYYQNINKDVYGKFSLATTTTTNDSIGIQQSRIADSSSVGDVMGDTLALVVQATTPATRQFLAGDATGAYEVTTNLGSMGGTSLTIDGKNSNGVNLGINGKGYEGITVGSGKTLTLKNIGSVEKTYDTNGKLTSNYTLNSSFGGFKKTSGYGGAICNNRGTLNIENVVFANNNVTSSSSSYDAVNGGAINNNYGTIGDITGDFVSNSASSSSSSASGGAIYNTSTIASITGDFVGNYASSYNAYGGAIYNQGTIGSISGNFTNNSATGSYSVGGAIYNQGTMTLLADGETYEISGNHAQNIDSGDGIYNSNQLTINSVNDGKWIINDSVMGGGTLNIKGDSVGGVQLNTRVSQNINVEHENLLNGSNLELQNSTLNIMNDEIGTMELDSLISNDTHLTLDADFSGAVGSNIDKFVVSGDATGVLYIDKINFLGNRDGEFTGQVLKLNGDQKDLQLAFGDRIIFIEDGATSDVPVTDSGARAFSPNDVPDNIDFGTILANVGTLRLYTTDTTNDSIAIRSDGIYDQVLTYLNQKQSPNVRNFNFLTADDVYTVEEPLEVTAVGELHINGVVDENGNRSTIDFNGNEGFYNETETPVKLVIENVKLVGADAGLIYNAGTNRNNGWIFGADKYVVTDTDGTQKTVYTTGYSSNDQGFQESLENGTAYADINNTSENLTFDEFVRMIRNNYGMYDKDGNSFTPESVQDFIDNWQNVASTTDFNANIKYNTTDLINVEISDYYGNNGSAVVNNGLMNTMNGVFKNNRNSSNYGGVLQNYGTIANLSGEFKNNRAYYGGAIYNDGTIDNISANFKYNKAEYSGNGRGGAIYNGNGTIGSITGDFVGNFADRGGGAIYNNSGSIDNITGNFTNNSVQYQYEAQSGAIHNDNGRIGSITGGDVQTYKYNVVYSEPTGLVAGKEVVDDIDNPDDAAWVYKTTIIDKDGVEHVVYDVGYNDPETGNRVGMTADDVANSNRTLVNAGEDIIDLREDNWITQNYGAETYEDAIAALADNNGIDSEYLIPDDRQIISYDELEYKGFFGNKVSSTDGNVQGGAIANNNNGIIDNINADFVLNNATSENQEALGGAIYNAGGIGSINGNFYYNSAIGAHSDGGAIFNEGEIGNITGDFVGNYAITEDGSGFSGGGPGGGGEVAFCGGAIHNKGIIGDITGDFVNNRYEATNANAQGGAIYNLGELGAIEGNFTENSTIAHGEAAPALGGAIYNGSYTDAKEQMLSGNSSSYGGSYGTASSLEMAIRNRGWDITNNLNNGNGGRDFAFDITTDEQLVDDYLTGQGYSSAEDMAQCNGYSSVQNMLSSRGYNSLAEMAMDDGYRKTYTSAEDAISDWVKYTMGTDNADDAVDQWSYNRYNIDYYDKDSSSWTTVYRNNVSLEEFLDALAKSYDRNVSGMDEYLAKEGYSSVAELIALNQDNYQVGYSNLEDAINAWAEAKGYDKDNFDYVEAWLDDRGYDSMDEYAQNSQGYDSAQEMYEANGVDNALDFVLHYNGYNSIQEAIDDWNNNNPEHQVSSAFELAYYNWHSPRFSAIYTQEQAVADFLAYTGLSSLDELPKALGYLTGGYIPSIKGDFKQNTATSDSGLAAGGALINFGKIGSIEGDFVENSAIGAHADGGAVYNAGEIGSIHGDFISNYAFSQGVLKDMNISGGGGSDSGGGGKLPAEPTWKCGGALYNDGIIDEIDGNFTDNHYEATYAQGNGGAVYNGENGTIGKIVGNFTSNYAINQKLSDGGTIFGIDVSDVDDTGDAWLIEEYRFSDRTVYDMGGIQSAQDALDRGITNFVIDGVKDYTDRTFDQFIAQYTSYSGHLLEEFYSADMFAERDPGEGYISTNSSHGGAIFNAGKIDSIEGDFVENHVEGLHGDGGAVFNIGTIGSIKGNFISNYAISNGMMDNEHDIDSHSGVSSDDGGNSGGNDFGWDCGGALYNDGIIGEIVGDFTDNHYEAVYAEGNGGAIFNGENGTITTISGNFTDNWSKSENNSAAGGAIYNAGTIADISGTFTNNSAIADSGNASGGAIFNGGEMGKITNSTFTGNSAISGQTFEGTLLDKIVDGSVSDGTIAVYEYDVLDDDGNSLGLFYTFDTLDNNGNIVRLTQGEVLQSGKPIVWGDDRRTASLSEIGAVTVEEAIAIVEQTMGYHMYSENDLEPVDISTGAEADGGAIANTGSLTVVNSSFTNNYAKSGGNYAYGGAIYTTNDLTLVAKDGYTSTISGNYVEDAYGRRNEAIFVEGGNLTITAQTGGKFVIDDVINNISDNTLTFNGDSTGVVDLNNAIMNKLPFEDENSAFEVELNDITLNLNKESNLNKADLIVNSGILSTINNEIGTVNLTSLESDESARYNIDIDLNTLTADMFSVNGESGSGNSNGIVYLNALNLIGETDQETYKIQILDVNDGGAQLMISDELKGGVAIVPDEVTYGDIYRGTGEITLATTNTLNDSIEISAGEVVTDLLGAINNKVTDGNKVFNFVTSDDTYVVENALNPTVGNLTINGVASADGSAGSTIDLNDTNGFVVGSDVSLTVKDTTLTGANGNAVYVEQGGNANLNNVSVVDTTSLGSGTVGGAILNEGGTIGDVSGTFTNNSATGVDAEGGAIYNASEIGDVVADFTNNSATSQDGSAIGGAIANVGGTMGEVSGTFTNNSAVSENGVALGGAIYSATDLTVSANNSTTEFTGNYTESNGERDDNAIYLDNSEGVLTLDIKNNGKVIMNDNVRGADGYSVDIIGDGTGTLDLMNDLHNANVSTGDVTINTINNQAKEYKVKSLTVKGNTNMNVDVDLAAKEMDRFTADTYGNHTGTLNVKGMNLLSDSTNDVTEIMFAQQGLKDAVRTSISSVGSGSGNTYQTTMYSPIFKYNVLYDNRSDAGYFVFAKGNQQIIVDPTDPVVDPTNPIVDPTDPTRPIPGGGGGKGYHVVPNSNPSSAFNPAVLASPVAAQAAGMTALNQAFDYAFAHSDGFMSNNYAERYAQIYGDRVALSTDYNGNLGHIDLDHMNKAAWVKPYSVFESVPLKNGPKVSAISYGTVIGGDTDIRTLKRGWSHVQTAYLGYHGSQLKYDGVDTSTNGGFLGVTETLYKGNFFTALTASVGAGAADTHSMYGRDDSAFLLAGVSNKTGYNFEFKGGKFIIQPMLKTSYTMVKTFDYTNAAGVRVNSDAAHNLQLEPTIKFIGNFENGWQPYATVAMVWDALHESNTTANGVKLPEMYTKPYVQYGVGIQRCWNDRYSAYGQAMVRNGGRNGVALTAGFRWTLGKDPNSQKVQNNTPEIKLSKTLPVGNHVFKQKDNKETNAKQKAQKPEKKVQIFAVVDNENSNTVEKKVLKQLSPTQKAKIQKTQRTSMK